MWLIMEGREKGKKQTRKMDLDRGCKLSRDGPAGQEEKSLGRRSTVRGGCNLQVWRANHGVPDFLVQRFLVP